MFWVGLVGHGADCDAARDRNHDENRDSVCPTSYVGVGVGTVYDGVRWDSNKRGRDCVQGTCREGVCVCVWVGWHSTTVVSRDCEQQHQHQHQLEHQHSRGGAPFSCRTAGFWNGLGGTEDREVTGTGAASPWEVSRCQVPEQPRSDFCCVWKSFRCSDPQVWPPI